MHFSIDIETKQKIIQEIKTLRIFYIFLTNFDLKTKKVVRKDLNFFFHFKVEFNINIKISFDSRKNLHDHCNHETVPESCYESNCVVNQKNEKKIVKMSCFKIVLVYYPLNIFVWETMFSMVVAAYKRPH